MKNNHREIEILDPERWNLKYTEKRKYYIQLHGNFWSDGDFLALNSDEKVLFLWILNASLRVNKGVVSICLESAKGVLRCSLDDIKDMLSSLESFDFIGLQVALRKTSKSQLIEEKRIEEKRRKSTELMASILDIWNRNAPNYNLPSVKVLNATRKKKLQSALKDFSDPEDWRKIFSVASQKGFTAKDGNKFIPNWDYVFRNNNWVQFYDEYEILFSNKESSDPNLAKSIEADLISSLMV